MYAPMQWDGATWMDATCAGLAVARQPHAYWASSEGQDDLRRRLKSKDTSEVGQALLICAGLRWFWGQRRLVVESEIPAETFPLAEIEAYCFHENPALWHAAVWARAVIYPELKSPGPPSSKLLDRLLRLWLDNLGKTPCGLVTPLALADGPVLPRKSWKPKLTPEEVSIVQKVSMDPPSYERPDSAAACIVAFHARSVCSDEELAPRVVAWRSHGRAATVDAVLAQMGPVGRKYLDKSTR
jgi:hypothetical protein